MKDYSREKVIHSSLKEVKRLGTDSNFPLPAPSIGIILKHKQFGGIDLSIHAPKLSSLIEGEILECEDDQLDVRLRRELLNLADSCQELADYLISEKKRLEEYAEKDILIHEAIEMCSAEIPSKIHAKIEHKPLNPPRASKPSTSSSLDIDLDLFS